MHHIVVVVASILSIFIASPASAQVVITQAKALAGGVTPGDTAGYPVTLSQSGAYVFESNLTVTPGTYGLFVTANNVDIDMKGFTLSGNGSGTYGLISAYGESRIHDGFINLFRYSGIYLRNNAWDIDHMQVVRNGDDGIDADNFRYISVRDSLVAANNRRGIGAGDNGSFRNSTFSGNGSYGILCLRSCHAEGNIIDSNTYGIIFRSGFVIGNTISNNTNYGIFDSYHSADTGIANNMLINNGSVTQTTLTVAVHPNTCVGKPC